MILSSNLEVDVNGEEIFLIDKKLFSSFSTRLRKLFGKSTGKQRNLKVIFHDFPGGAKCFELMARFCYSHGKIDIASSNVFFLHYGAIFLEMPQLINQTEEHIEKIHFWPWSDLIPGLRQCQDLTFSIKSSHIRDILNCLVGKFMFPCIHSPSTSSSMSSSFQFSGDTSTENSRNSNSQTTWWFEDLLFLNIDLFEKIINLMLSQKFDQVAICSFMFYYQKTKYSSAAPVDKCKIIETLINLLFTVDESYISSRRVLGTFQMALSLKLSKCCKKKLEKLVASWLDQATLDDLLIRSPKVKKYAYDVKMILRLLKLFLRENSEDVSQDRLKKVASLIDSYSAEVAPDPYLKPSLFEALIAALPEFARDSYDKIYHAMDIYLEVHRNVTEEEKEKLCSAINYSKLSSETLNQVARNKNFRSGLVVSLLASQEKRLLKEVDANKITSTFCDTRRCGIHEAQKIVILNEHFDIPRTKLKAYTR